MPTVTTNYFRESESISLSGDTWIVSLMDNHINSATNDVLKNYSLWTEVSVHEVVGTGYVSGAPLQNVTIDTNDVTNTIFMDADDITFTTVTISTYGCCIWRLADGLIMGFVDFGQMEISQNSNFQIIWNANGILNRV
jgi:hypothetical protein